MIANARMYSLVPAAGAAWRHLFAVLSATAGSELTYLEHKPPAPIGELWRRTDLGAVFMCSLPYSRSVPHLPIVAVPVPAPPAFSGQACNCSELVVRADSSFRTLEDTFGHRVALTGMDSQAGCLALLYHLMAKGGRGALYQRVIEPRLTPLGSMTAVVDGLADVAPIDSYAFALAQQYVPEVTSQLRVIERTVPTPMPPIISRQPVAPALQSAFLQADKHRAAASVMGLLQVERFVQPDPEIYDVLKRRFDAAITYWHAQPFAVSVHPAFGELATGPLQN
jgi:ABC-type phosphate/phosphonate transport system substrate-binding protein